MTKKRLISVGVIGLLSVSVLVLGGVASWADEIERMQVQIMTLDGKQLMEQEYYGANVNPLSSLDGRPLADGVYLLVVRSRDTNGNVTMRVQKFAVLRGRVHISRPNAGLQNDPQGWHKLQPQSFNKATYIILKMVDILQYKKVATVKLSTVMWVADIGVFLVCSFVAGGPQGSLVCKVIEGSLLAAGGALLEFNIAPNSEVDVYCTPYYLLQPWLYTFLPPCFIVPKGALGRR